jgi:hypothetical protein
MARTPGFGDDRRRPSRTRIRGRGTDGRLILAGRPGARQGRAENSSIWTARLDRPLESGGRAVPNHRAEPVSAAQRAEDPGGPRQEDHPGRGHLLPARPGRAVPTEPGRRHAPDRLPLVLLRPGRDPAVSGRPGRFPQGDRRRDLCERHPELAGADLPQWPGDAEGGRVRAPGARRGDREAQEGGGPAAEVTGSIRATDFVRDRHPGSHPFDWTSWP